MHASNHVTGVQGTGSMCSAMPTAQSKSNAGLSAQQELSSGGMMSDTICTQMHALPVLCERTDGLQERPLAIGAV